VIQLWLLILAYFISSITDIKTKTIPEKLIYIFIAIAILINHDLPSICFGSILFLIGCLIYKLKQWGDGDALLLALAGFSLGIKSLAFLSIFLIITFFYLFPFFILEILTKKKQEVPFAPVFLLSSTLLALIH